VKILNGWVLFVIALSATIALAQSDAGSFRNTKIQTDSIKSFSGTSYPTFPYGLESLNQSSLLLQETLTNGTNTIGIRANTSVPASYSLVLPSAQGGASTTLINDGSGNLSWGSGGVAIGGAVSGGTAKDVLYVDGSGNLGETNSFAYDYSTGYLGLGTTNPGAPVDAEFNWGSSVTTNEMFRGIAYGDTSRISARRANGTQASPTAISSGQNLGAFTARGYNGSAFPTNAQTTVQSLATENFTTSANGTALGFSTTTNGTTTLSERMRIDQSGYIGMGSSVPAAPLDVATDWGSVSSTHLQALFTGYSDTSRLTIRRADGTKSSPSAVLVGEQMGNVNFRGYNGATFPSAASAYIFASATENFSTSANGTSMSFGTAANGTTTPTVRMFIDNDGDTNIGAVGSYSNARLAVSGGHLKSVQTTAPVANVTANAGTGATCSVSNATDTAGIISLATTATSPASGDQCDISFNLSYNVAPICIFSPANDQASYLTSATGVYLTTDMSTINVNFYNLDAVGHNYVWTYNCIETEVN
jgi:hypothetical protein